MFDIKYAYYLLDPYRVGLKFWLIVIFLVIKNISSAWLTQKRFKYIEDGFLSLYFNFRK